MQKLTIEITEQHLAHLTEIAKRHGIAPELFAASVVQHALEGEDVRREIHRLRVDLAMLVQTVVYQAGLKPTQEEAWEWAKKELLHPLGY